VHVNFLKETDEMDARTSPTSQREYAKAERRRRIVEAASSLVRESGFDAVSMMQIADSAEVSPATVYNLFKTKGAIFRQVFDLDLENFERLLAQAPAHDPLERLFVAITLAAKLYRRDPKFYRAMARGGDGAENLGSAIGEPRTRFWCRQVAAAVEGGQLRPDTDADVLGVTLSQLMGGIFLAWAANLISPERMAKEATYGFALVLFAYTTEKSAVRLKGRIRELQGLLRRSRRTLPRRVANGD
jgi:AcrR family transcriptional regulator